MTRNINLKRRYPNSRTEDITDAFEKGFETGYNIGYDVAFRELQGECKRLQDRL